MLLVILYSLAATYLAIYGIHVLLLVAQYWRHRRDRPRTMERKTRVLIAKPGLDGHDRGAKVIARMFRDAGMEVIYTGLHQTPAAIVEAAVQEDVDVIGLSILSGAHLSICRRVLEALEMRKVEDILLIVGGTIVDEDIPTLKEIGVAWVFPPGSPVDAGVKFVEEWLARKAAG